jgi:uncharacterized protein (TIGR02996 family)
MAMLTEQEFLIREIAADPESDVPRLIYADWLEERGDPLGEFIRVQCKLARLPQSAVEAAPLFVRQFELLDRYRRAWLEDLCPRLRWYTFRRGFVDEIVLDFETIVAEKGRLLRRTPIADLGTGLESPEQAAELAKLPEFSQLRHLRLDGSPLGNAGIQQLVASPHFPKLKSLWLKGCGIDAVGVETLAQCAALSGLVLLDLSGNPIGYYGAQILIESETFAHLDDTNCSPTGARLARSLPDGDSDPRAAVVESSTSLAISAVPGAGRSLASKLSVADVLRHAREGLLSESDRFISPSFADTTFQRSQLARQPKPPST